MPDETKAAESVWAIVELMGHVKLAGRVTEEEKFGVKMGRIDIPTNSPCDCNASENGVCARCGDIFTPMFVTQFFGGASLYRITIVTEEVARIVAKRTTVAPVHSWDFPKVLAAPISQGFDDDGPDDTDRNGY